MIGNQDAFDLVLMIFTNFNLKRRDLPSVDAIECLWQALGIEETPGWFLEESQWDWNLAEALVDHTRSIYRCALLYRFYELLVDAQAL